MSLKTRTQFQRTLRRVKQPHTGWTDVFPAVMGKADGTVQTGTPGEIYVRNSVNGQVVVVHNSGNVPSIANLQIEVGRRVDKPSLWQIKGQLENYNTPAGGDILVGYHADQHRFPEADTVWVDRKQVTHFTVLVSDAENFIVQVYGGVAVTPHGVCLVENQTIDLSSYVPTSGAKYVSIVLETDGTLTVLDGTEFESRELATVTDIPLPAVDEYLLAFALLYEFQESLSNDDIRLVQPFGVEIAVPEVLDDLIDVEVTGATDGQVLTFDSYSQTWIAADPTGGGASELDDLIDVEVPAPTDGQYLVYDAYSNTWFASDGPIPLIFDDLTSQVPDGSDHFDLSAEAPNGVLLFFNGILQPESEYTMDMDNLGLTTDFSPEAGDTLIAIHGAVGGGGGGGSSSTETKGKLSGSTDGKGIKVGATSTPGTTVHTAVSGTSEWDEVWLHCVNTSSSAVKLTIEWGETTAPDGHIEVTIPPESGPFPVIPGFILNNGNVIRAFAGSANVLVVHGLVKRITDEAKQKFSGSADGKGIKVGATSTPGTTVHTAVSGTSEWDEVWLHCVNTSSSAVKLTIEWGETTAPDGNIEVTIPPESGPFPVIPGFILNNGNVIRAFAGSANVLVVHGFVDRITA